MIARPIRKCHDVTHPSDMVYSHSKRITTCAARNKLVKGRGDRRERL